jgi:hypothetical protein
MKSRGGADNPIFCKPPDNEKRHTVRARIFERLA